MVTKPNKFGPATELQIALAGGGHKTVIAYQTDVPGLVVNQDTRSFTLFRDCWNLTHANTGCTLARHVTAPRIHAIIAALRSVDFDWTSVHSLDDREKVPEPLRMVLAEAVEQRHATDELPF